MARIVVDGFNPPNYRCASFPGRRCGPGNPGICSTSENSFVSMNNDAVAIYQLKSDYKTLFFKLDFLTESFPDEEPDVLISFWHANTEILTISVDTDGYINVYRGGLNGVFLGSSEVTLPTGELWIDCPVYNRLDGKIVIDNNDGEVQLKIDGEDVFSFSGNTGSENINKVILGYGVYLSEYDCLVPRYVGPYQEVGFQYISFDNLILDDSDWIDSLGFIFWSSYTEVGDYDELKLYSLFGETPEPKHIFYFLNLDDYYLPPVEGVYSTTGNKKDSLVISKPKHYDKEPLSYVPLEGKRIRNVKVSVSGVKIGYNTPSKVQIGLRINNKDYLSEVIEMTEEFPMKAEYVIFEKNPETNAPFLKSEFPGIQAILKIIELQ